MRRPSPSPASRARTGVATAALALLAAAAAFVLPALDAELPGGSLPWQVAALALAVAGAFGAAGRLRGAEPRGWSRVGRALALAAVLLALLWAAGVALLWLIWPR